MNEKIQSPEALRHEQVCELGGRIHTALRKCCDSTNTTIAYNLIHVLNDEWTLWLERMLDALFVKPAIWLYDTLQDGEPCWTGMTNPDATTRYERIKRWHDQKVYQRFGDLWPGDGRERDFWAKDRFDKSKPSEELYSVLCGVFSLFDEKEWDACLTYVGDGFAHWVQTGEMS